MCRPGYHPIPSHPTEADELGYFQPLGEPGTAPPGTNAHSTNTVNYTSAPMGSQAAGSGTYAPPTFGPPGVGNQFGSAGLLRQNGRGGEEENDDGIFTLK